MAPKILLARLSVPSASSRLRQAMGALAAMLWILPAQARPGDCPLTGHKGALSIVPVKSGELTVETNLPSPGWWDGDTPDSMTGGFEYCLAVNIARRLGLGSVHVVNVAFDALVAGRTRSYDLALSQVSMTAERRRLVDFSISYYKSSVGVLAKRSAKVDAERIRTMRIGVQGGTTGASYVQAKVKPQQPPLVFSDSSEMFTALLAGQIDVVVTDVSIILELAAASHGRFYVAGRYPTDETYGAILPKGSKSSGAFNQILQELSHDGTLDMLSKKYLTGPMGVDPDAIPAWAQ